MQSSDTSRSGGLSLNAEDHTLFLTTRLLAGLERRKELVTFPEIDFLLAYDSPFLKARVTPRVYTINESPSGLIEEVKHLRYHSRAPDPVEGVFDFDLTVDEAYLTIFNDYLALSCGKKRTRWGPGYKGTLGLSGTHYAPFHFYHLELNLKDRLRAEAFLTGFDDEREYIEEYLGTLHSSDTSLDIRRESMPPRFGAGQRLELRMKNGITLGIYELVDFFGVNDLNRFANPLQFYYVANRASGTNNANQMGGGYLDVSIGRFRAYTEILNDDVTMFDKSGNPDKYAWQAGARWHEKGWLRRVGLEYTHVSPYTYGHSRVLNRHMYWYESLGWPWGNDQDVFNLHALWAPWQKMSLKSEISWWIKGRGTVFDDWHADGTPDMEDAPYWPGDADKMLSLLISVYFRPVEWIDWNSYFRPAWVNGKPDVGLYSYLSVSLPRNVRTEIHL